MDVFYLGRPGTALIPVRSPEAGVDRSPTAYEAAHQLLGGGFAVDRAPGVRRRWQLRWTWDDEVWWIISAFYRHQYGPGPFALIDPAQINYLTGNQASGTDVRADTDGFTVSGDETVASSTAVAYQGSRSLRWRLPETAASGILALAAPWPLTAWPVPPSLPWTFTAKARLAGLETVVPARLALQWLDAAGAQVAETLGTEVSLTTTWGDLLASGAVPAGAVYLLPRVRASVSPLVTDTYTRSVSNGWGTADSGQAWTTSGGAASDYSVDGSRGVILLPTGSTTPRLTLLAGTHSDCDIRVTVRSSAVATGAALNAQLRFRILDASNYYRASIIFATDSNVDLQLNRVVAGSATTFDTAADAVAYSGGSDVHLHLQAVGSSLRAKVWTGATEPAAWMVVATDTTYTSGQLGTRNVQSASNSNTDPTISWDDLTLRSSSSDVHLDALQLQIGPDATIWRPGEGPALVSLVVPQEVPQLVVPGQHARDISIGLVEVGGG